MRTRLRHSPAWAWDSILAVRARIDGTSSNEIERRCGSLAGIADDVRLVIGARVDGASVLDPAIELLVDYRTETDETALSWCSRPIAASCERIGFIPFATPAA